VRCYALYGGEALREVVQRAAQRRPRLFLIAATSLFARVRREGHARYAPWRVTLRRYARRATRVTCAMFIVGALS